MTYYNISDIKARVKASWSHKNHKFQSGDHAEVSGQVIPREWVGHDGTIIAGRSYVSKVKQRRVGRVGKVVAVSCLPCGRTRNNGEGHGYNAPSRMYTKYYIQFRDDVIMGFEPHHLNKAFGSARELVS